MTKTVSGIYQIRNIVNDKVYIGSSIDIEKRWKIHKNDLTKNKHHSSKLQNAWDKFGEECFVFEILEEIEEVSRDEIFETEQKYINQYEPHINGYNMASSSLPLKKYKLKKNNQIDEFHVEGTIRKVGNSLGIILPSIFVKDMNLLHGSTVNIIYKNKNIIIKADASEEIIENEQKSFDEAIAHIKEYLENNFDPKQKV